MRIEHTKYYSKKIGELARGCRLCVKGQKLVLFVTGLCPRECFFCPLSPDKMKKDVIYANERPVKKDADIIAEAKAMDARGAGVTGGDPLLKIERTLRYIRLLKKEFGRFHIHLYTSLDLVDRERLRALYEAGLDEIRFHPDLDSDKLWKRIILAREFDWDVGIEIPVIPGKDIKRLIDFISDKVDFLNLNELEVSDANLERFAELGFCTKDEFSYGISGSEKLADELLNYCQDKKIDVHYCSTKLKDKVQLAKRIERMARVVSKPYDKVTSEGLLIRGAVYIPGLEPGMNYRERLRMADPEAIKKLEEKKSALQKRWKIKHIEIDSRKLRLLMRVSDLKRIAKKVLNKCAIVEEYPTWDQFEVEVEFLN